MIEFAQIEIGSGRCVACSRCAPYEPGVPRSLEEITSALSEVAFAWKGSPGPNALLCGSEPFDHPQLPAVIAACATSGFERIGLRSAAGALTLPANAAGVIAAGVRFVEVVLLGDESTHDKLVGRVGAYADATAGCRAFLAAAAAQGVDVVVGCHVPACRHNVMALGGAVAGAAAAGAVAVNMDVSSLPAADSDAVIAALETAAMSRIAGFVTGAAFEVPEPFGESPWRVLPHGSSRATTSESAGS